MDLADPQVWGAWAPSVMHPPTKSQYRTAGSWEMPTIPKLSHGQGLGGPGRMGKGSPTPRERRAQHKMKATDN